MSHGSYLFVNITMVYHDIESLNQAGYSLLYKTVPRSWLRPCATLAQCCEFVNHCLQQQGRDLSQWDAGQQDQIARLLWVNLFYQNLARDPIRKPLLVTGRGLDLEVICGDTRLMVLDLANSDQLIPVVTIVPTAELTEYDHWQLIVSNQQLIAQLHFNSHAQIIIRIQPDYWFEIGDVDTANHLHSVDYRIKLMQNYIDSAAKDFEFDAAWARTPVDWIGVV